MVIVSLEVPLAVNLQRRAESEIETRSVSNAQTIAFGMVEQIAAEGINDLRSAKAMTILGRAARQADPTVGGRVIVVTEDGTVIADSQSEDSLGQRYLRPSRPELEVALNQQTPYTDVRYSEELGFDIMATAVPLTHEGDLLGAVRITRSMDEVGANVRRIVVGLVAIGAAGVVAGLIIAIALSISFSRPLTRLAGAAMRLGSGELETRAGKVGGATEIQELARSFDEMADRLESTVKAQREFVANASHQLRTPLTGMKLRLESAAAEAASDDLRAQLAAADKEVDRLAEIVERLLVMARRVEMEGSGQVDLADAVAAGLERWQERAERAGASVETIGGSAVAVFDRNDLDQILDNLIHNAISYAPGPVVVEVGRAEGIVFVAVQDRGTGIPEDERERVTDRFYRGKGAAPGGSGLGLAIVRELAEKWGGRLAVTSPPAGGTRVEVLLNAAEDRT